MNRPTTLLFPKEEKVGYSQNNQIIIFSINTVLIEHNLTFPFPILFYSLPIDDEYMLLVNLDNPHILLLWNITTSQKDSELEFDSPILNFSCSGSFSCVVLEESTVILRSRPLIIHKVIETSSSLSTFSLIPAPNDDNHCIFVYANDIRMTCVTVMTIPSSSTPKTFETHKTPIRFLTVSNNAKFIATVSLKGTIVRLWSFDGVLLKETRRGLTPAIIEHMSFSPCSQFLSVSSNHFTCHIFKIDESILKPQNQQSIPAGWLTFLPKADIAVPVQNSKYFASYILDGGSILCTVSDSGILHIYDIDISTNKSNFKSKITIPKIAHIIDK